MPFVTRVAPVPDIAPLTLYRILRLRVDVFVVEQNAAYAELDGRDIEPGAELMWAEEDERVVATLRLLRDAEAMRIGRVVADSAVRGRGAAGHLMREAVARCEQQAPLLPIVLDAQSHLEHWYARFGFVVDGAPFDEDGIPHVPMRRSSPAAPLTSAVTSR